MAVELQISNKVHYMSDAKYPSLETAEQLVQLFEVPRDQRSDEWVERFLAAIPSAALRCSEERVFNGPDGFLYFGLYLPKSGEQFTAISLENVLTFCCQEGLGVAVFGDSDEEPEWVFNYGSVWNYSIHKSFYQNPFANTIDDSSDAPKESDDTEEPAEPTSESVLIAQPSEEFLPLFVRAVLMRDLHQQTVDNPAMLMMVVPNGNQYLVFNIFPEDFEKEHFEFIQQYIMWALPQGYAIATVPTDSELVEHFTSLREQVTTLN